MIKSQTTTSVLSLILSLLASQHHMLHMVILMLLGESTNTLGAILGIRRFMIAFTCIVVGFSIYQLFKHRRNTIWGSVMTAISVLVSLGFVVNTLMTFGW